MQRNRTILHVDDDPNILRIVAKQLGKRGYDIVSIEDPTQCARSLITTGARLVILDVDMPTIDGLTLLEDIKYHDGGIQAIMLTGAVSMSTVLQSMRWGAEACVFKPITDFDPLVASIEATFKKIDRWWDSLEDLNQRKSSLTAQIE